MLSMISMMTGYQSAYWLTFNQVRERGGNVRKGEKGSPCFFWKIYDGKPGKGGEGEGDTTSEGNKRFVARYYTVFNVEQCDGLDYPKPVLPDPTTSGATPIEKAEKIVSGYHGPTMETRGSQPCYIPISDTVVMPARELFFSPEAFYSTMFGLDPIWWTVFLRCFFHRMHKLKFDRAVVVKRRVATFRIVEAINVLAN